MGELTRRYDWSKTALGVPDHWSTSLRTLIQMMLTSRFPMLIFWGDELITFYNDAFRPSLGNDGKHPGSLGQPGEQSWAESWPVIGPMIRGIMTGEQAVWFEDQKLPIYRGGAMGYAYWTYSFSPLTDDMGAVRGVLVTCSETTKAVESIDQLRQLVDQNQTLRQEEQTARLALQNAIELAELGTWIMDVGTGATFLSQRHADMFGLELTSLPFEQAFTIVHPDDRPRVRAAFEAAMQPGSDGHYAAEYRIIHGRTGQYRYIRARGELHQDEQGQPISISGTTQDVTLERELQLVLEQQVQQRTQELLTANQDLIRSNQNLEQFAYIASHDLQEPLRKIQQFGDLLQNQYGETLGEGRAYLQRMQVAASRMSTLIRDLLAFSRIATTQVIAQPVELSKVVAEALESLSVAIDESQAQITVDDLPVVQGDPVQLSQVFQNLLSNALKFRRTSEGQPVAPQIAVCAQRIAKSDLLVSAHPSRDAEFYYLIEVTDNGIGFNEKYTDRIFQVFQRLHGRNEFAGTGVGLAIVQKVVTNHGGAITASSQPGQGATFSIYLPA